MTNYYYNRGSEVVYFPWGNWGNGSDIGHFQITPYSDYHNTWYGCMPVMTLSMLDHISCEVNTKDTSTMTFVVVEELQVILDNYKRIRFKIENKLFIRKKTRRKLLESNQRAIDALCTAITTLQKEEAENDKG